MSRKIIDVALNIAGVEKAAWKTSGYRWQHKLTCRQQHESREYNVGNHEHLCPLRWLMIIKCIWDGLGDTFHLWYSSSLLLDRFLISLGICLLLLQVALVSIGSLGVFWCPTKVTSLFAFLAGRDSLLWPGNNPLTTCWPAVLSSSVSFSGVVLLPFENLWMLLGSVVGLHNSSPEKWGTFN